MKIEERKEIVKKTVESVIVGRKCDVCGSEITEFISGGLPRGQYNYFAIRTWHNDWGNDSVESHEYYDACSPECVMKFAKLYIEGAYKNVTNTHNIEISHVRCLADGAE